MEKYVKQPLKAVFKTDMNISLANALRRSVNEIPTVAISEVDIYKNDSALYDDVVAHRIGLIPIKNQKLKEDETVEMKISVKAKGKLMDVNSGEFGEQIVIPNIPIVLLDKEQEFEAVARAKTGKGIEHAKFSPGIMYYRNLSKVEIGKDAEKSQELAEIYPRAFAFEGGKLKVKNEWEVELDDEDAEQFKGLKITPQKELVFFVEAWGQMDATEVFNDAVKALSKNLDIFAKELK